MHFDEDTINRRVSSHRFSFDLFCLVFFVISILIVYTLLVFCFINTKRRHRFRKDLRVVN